MDYYTSVADAALRGVSLSNNVTFQQSPRASGNGYSLSFTNDGNYRSPQTIWNGVTTVIFGCGLFMSSLPAQDDRIFYVCNEYNNGLCDFGIRASTGKIYATRANTQLGSDSTLTLSPSNTWYYIEAKVVIGTGTSGSIQVRVNGTQYLNVTGVNTVSDTNDARAWNLFVLANGTMRFDDIYMADTTGSYNNDFLGDVKVVSSAVTSNGITNNWTPSTASNYQNVDEWPANTTDYNYTSNAGDIDNYRFLTVSQDAGNIYGIQVSAYTQVANGSARPLRLQCSSNGSTSESGDKYAGAGFAYRTGIFERNPDGNVAWVDSAVNAASFGVKLQS
jgi:hypothetical protein